MTLPVVFTANGPSGYNLNNSLRFRRSASAYLNRTFSTPTNGTTWTISYWAKLGILGRANHFAPNLSTNEGGISIESDYALYINPRVGTVGGAGTNYFLGTTQVFRDPSAWYHIVVALDTTQATASNRVKLYINGTQVTAFSTASYPPQNSTPIMGSAVSHAIGRVGEAGYEYYYDGLFGEMNYVDGQALAATSFGSFNSLTGVWQPAKYTGTYGTNGFYLPFTNTTSTTTLGYDFSGNSNNWTTNNLSLTTGSTYDSMTDVPTLTSATTANYCVINGTTAQPTGWGAATTFSNGNLTGTMPNAGTDAPAYGTIALPRSGKWYWEVTITNSTVPGAVGVSESSMKRPDGTGPICRMLYSGGGTGVSKAYDGTNLTGSYTYFSNATLGVACDMDNGKLFVSVNGTYVNSGDPVAGTGAIFTDLLSTSPGGGSWLPLSFGYNGHVHNHNYAQQPLSYTPPTGYVALNTYNLPTSTIVKGNTVMDATTYTGTGTTGLAITNAGAFKPDFVWIKLRSTSGWHQLQDSNRGSGYVLYSNATDAEANKVGTSQIQFDSGGFTLIGSSPANGDINTNGATFVGWQWQAGQGTTSSNTSGSITSTVSVNASAGFSVVTYSANGSTGTVGHGLGVAPSMIIVKKRNAAERWTVFHTSTSNAYLYLNETFAAETGNANIRFGNNSVVVQPTSSVFSIGSSNDVNGTSGTYVAYCWSEIAGFSKFGSYVGNGSTDGTFVYTGFRPKFIMVKCSSNGSTNWFILDTSRDTYNLAGQSLEPNLSNAEYTPASSGYPGDILSNGFKWRDNSNNANNYNGYTYIYMAFAENPFKNALAR